MWGFKLPVSAAAVALLLSAMHTTAAAQTRLFVLFRGAAGLNCHPTDCEPGHVLDIDVERGAILHNTQVLHARERPSTLGVTPDGRYLLWTGSESDFATTYLSAFDAAARTQWPAVPLADRSFLVDLFVHPSRTRAYLWQSPLVLIAEPGQLKTITPDCQNPALETISGDGARLFVRCPGPTLFSGDTAVLDGETGARIATIPEPHFVQGTNAAGSELFTARFEAGQTPLYRRWDVSSGMPLVERRVGAVSDSPNEIHVDPRSGRIWVILTGGAIQVVDPVTLEPLGRFPGPTVPRVIFTFVAFDRQRPEAYVTTSEESGPAPFRYYTTQVRVIDTDSLTVTRTATLPGASAVAGLVLAPRPPRPAALAATVAVRNVSLQWSLGNGAPGSSLFVDAGSAPGLTNLASVPVAAGTTTVVAQDVPAGTYYVRVRTRTAGGVESISNEVAVTVR
jgi:hypothetical protein